MTYGRAVDHVNGAPPPPLRGRVGVGGATGTLSTMSNENARQLRINMTDAERRLWRHLRLQQLDGRRFRRQVPIGPYVVDFACLEAKLLIEVDGGQHAEALHYDAARTAWLEARGYQVLRFWNNDVLSNTDGVLSLIRETLLTARGATPHPNPPPQGGRES
jgi:very-short-patch-repair endonuclease